MITDPKIIDGRKWAREQQKIIKSQIELLTTKPKIVSILIGDDPSSVLYSQIKQKKASDVGIDFEWINFSIDTAYEKIVHKIQELNVDITVTGVMIQLPVPREFLGDKLQDNLIQTIAPQKDVDGLTGKGKVLPATVAAILSILESCKVEIKGKTVVVVGQSAEVGRPAAEVFKKMEANVITCNSKTEDLSSQTKQADILVSSTGVPGIINGDMVKEGVVVIDVGAEKVNGKVVGDVDFISVYPKASLITPVPGGVGPMTVIMLMKNALTLSKSLNQ